MQMGNSLVISSFLSSLLSAGGLDTVGNSSICCYKGAMPTDTALSTFTPASRSSDLLATFTGCTFQVVGNALILNTAPAAVLPAAAGTIAWAAIQGQNNVNIILEPSVIGGQGALILSSLTATLGTQLSVDSSGSGVSIVFYQ